MKRVLLSGASALMAIAMVAAPSAAGATEYLQNGSFEDLGGAVPEGWGGYTYYAGGPVILPGWTVDFGSVDVTTITSPWSPASDGENSLDINGWAAGEISQSFLTTLGRLYTVSFDYSRNLAGAPDPATATVSLGSSALNVSAANDGSFGTVGHMQWKSGSFTFVGTGNIETLKLTATVPGNGGVFFDKISVQAVPEPATWAMMIGGFGMAGAALRRRRALATAA